MRGLVEMVFSYQTLLARAERLRIPLEPEEARQLVDLALALGWGEAPGARRMPRVLCPWPVTLTLPDGFLSGRLRDLSGGGMRVFMDAPPPPSTRLLVHLAGPLQGEEFIFPARVVWRHQDEGPVVGLAFEGMPRHTAPREIRGERRRRITPLVA